MQELQLWSQRGANFPGRRLPILSGYHRAVRFDSLRRISAAQRAAFAKERISDRLTLRSMTFRKRCEPAAPFGESGSELLGYLGQTHTLRGRSTA